MKKFFLLFSFGVLLLFIIIGILPGLFTSKSPHEVHFPKIKPNNGKNSYIIENNSDEIIIIDSLLLIWDQDNIKLSDKVQISQGEKYINTFFIKDFLHRKVKDKEIKIRLYGSSNMKYIKIVFNNNINALKLRKKNGYYQSSINKYDFTGGTTRFKNRFMEKSVLGTDQYGRDIWTRLVYGTKIIMIIVLLSIIISIPVGLVFGLIRGYYNNMLSNLMGVVSNFSNSISVYLLAMLVVALFGHKIIYLVIAFSLVQWVEIEKVIFERVNALKKSDFILAAKSFGKSNINIITTEIFVYCVPDIIIGLFFLAKRIILIEASLSFLGYSVNIPNASWGNIISGIKYDIYSSSAIWIILPPIIAIIAIAFSLNTFELFLKERFNRNA